MIEYYTNRELADCFGVKLAKWKRWSREFLPPDPLGGLQSGYARQYVPDDAFKVMLGGHLVAELKFAVPQARQILTDLKPWLKRRNFHFDFAGRRQTAQGAQIHVTRYRIVIQQARSRAAVFRYEVVGIIDKRHITYQGYPAYQTLSVEESLVTAKTPAAEFHGQPGRLLEISLFFEWVRQKLKA